MTPFAIAGVQMYISAIENNVQRMRERLALVMHLFPWVDMVMFSELAPHGPLLQFAAEFPSDTEKIFQELAAHHQIWLLPGSMFEKHDGKVFNTASVIDPEGTVVGRYRKMFPFYPYEQGVEPGSEFLTFDVPGIARFGVSICYDMWFPETTRTLASMGAEVILHPTMTSTIDRHVELSIARASAVCNQCFFFDINGLGDGGTGHSIIVGPNGDVLHEASSGVEIIPLEIDIDRVRRAREVGLKGLGQPLKSFRARQHDFKLYHPGSELGKYLQTLGPLEKPGRRHPPPASGRAHDLAPEPTAKENTDEPAAD